MTEPPSPLQRRVFELLDGHPTSGDRLDVACHYLLVTVIVGSVALLVIGTVPEIETRWGTTILALDFVAGVLFAVEYLARVWTAPVDPRYRDGWRGRLRFMRSPLAVLDLLATVAILLPHLPIDFRQARLIRLVALLRVSKLGRFTQSFTLARRVFRARRDDLIVAAGAVAFLLLFGSTLVYFAERDAQPEKFGSIPHTLWWGIATVTTVGYGDVYPITLLGRVFGGLLAVLGIASFALPTAILGAAFLDELQRDHAQQSGGVCPTCKRPLDPGPAAGLPEQ